MIAETFKAERAYRVLGITDEHSACDFCGKVDLRRTVAFEPVDGGEVVYAGTTCAAYVKLMILGADGEQKPRTAAQILSLAQRAELEKQITEVKDALIWRAVLACARMVEIVEEADAKNRSNWEPVRYEVLDNGTRYPVPRARGIEHGMLNPFRKSISPGLAFKLDDAEEFKNLTRRLERMKEIAAWVERVIAQELGE